MSVQFPVKRWADWPPRLASVGMKYPGFLQCHSAGLHLYLSNAVHISLFLSTNIHTPEELCVRICVCVCICVYACTMLLSVNKLHCEVHPHCVVSTCTDHVPRVSVMATSISHVYSHGHEKVCLLYLVMCFHFTCKMMQNSFLVSVNSIHFSSCHREFSPHPYPIFLSALL